MRALLAGVLFAHGLAAGPPAWSRGADGVAEIGYHIPAGTPAGAEAALERALAEWAKYAELRFVPVDDPRRPRVIAFVIAGREHGDDWPFDGPHGAVGHAFDPGLAEPLAGDVHLDADEDWSGGHAYSVALHEIGHALGVAHSNDPAAVMYPMHRPANGLGAADIEALRRIYTPKRWHKEDRSPLRVETGEVTRGAGPWFVVRGRVWGGESDIRVRWRGESGGWSDAIGSYEWLIPAAPDGMGALTVEARWSGGVATATIPLESPKANAP